MLITWDRQNPSIFAIKEYCTFVSVSWSRMSKSWPWPVFALDMVWSPFSVWLISSFSPWSYTRGPTGFFWPYVHWPLECASWGPGKFSGTFSTRWRGMRQRLALRAFGLAIWRYRSGSIGPAVSSGLVSVAKGGLRSLRLLFLFFLWSLN